MTDLERRALLGDKQAQEECTKIRIMLPCPFCGSTVKRKIEFAGLNFFKCQKCGAVVSFDNDHYNSHKNEGLVAWNTRTTPPIGRCRECKHFKNYECTNEYISTDHEGGASYSLNFYVEDYCSFFESRCDSANE